MHSQGSSDATTLQEGHCTCLFLSPFFLFFIKLLPMPYPVVCLIGVYIYQSIRLAHWETVWVQGELPLGGISTAGESAVNNLAVEDGLLLREI